MPDAGGEVRYKITGDSTSLVGATKEAGAAMQDAGAKGTEAHERLTKASEKTELSNRTLRSGFRLFGSEIAEFAHLGVEALEGGLTLAFLGLALVVAKVIEAFKRADEAMEKLREEAAEPLTNQIEIQRERIVTLADSMERLREKLDDAARSERTLARTAEETSQMLREQASADESVRESQKAAELEALEKLHKEKLIAEEDYEKQRLEIEKKYRALRRAAEEQEIKDEIALRTEMLEQAAAQGQALSAKAKSADIEKVNAESASKSRDADVAKTEADAKKAEEALAKFERDNLKQKNIDDFEEARKHGWSVAQSGYTGDYDEWVRLKNIAESKRATANETPAAAAKAKVQADQAAHEADEAARRATENSAFQNEQQWKLQEDQIRLGIKQKADRQISGNENTGAPPPQIPGDYPTEAELNAWWAAGGTGMPSGSQVKAWVDARTAAAGKWKTARKFDAVEPKGSDLHQAVTELAHASAADSAEALKALRATAEALRQNAADKKNIRDQIVSGLTP
jgi:hypothetical protein